MTPRKKTGEVEPAVTVPTAGHETDEKPIRDPTGGMSLDKLAETAVTFRRADELPDAFVATVTSAEVRTDENGRICLYLRLQLRDGSQTAVKYTPLHLSEVIPLLKKLGFSKVEELEGVTFAFKKKAFRIGFPRPIPVEVVGRQ